MIVTEEECLVLYYWSAKNESKLVATKHRLLWVRSSGRRKEVARIQCFVAEKLESGSVKVVSARLRCQVNNAAVEAAELSGRTVNLDLELLNGFDNREERYLTRLRLQHRNAVEEVLVRSRASAVDAWK